MEFSRWGIDKIIRISDRYRDFTAFLTDVLEGERSLIDTGREPAEALFQARDDFSLVLESRRLRLRPPERVGAVFRSLAPYFEAGFLLRPSLDGSSSGQHVSLDSMFLFGKSFQPGAKESPQVELPLPRFSSGRVYRGRVAPVLEVFRLDGHGLLKDASAFAFQPAPGSVILLICNRPHPWQVGAVERAVAAVEEALR